MKARPVGAVLFAISVLVIVGVPVTFFETLPHAKHRVTVASMMGMVGVLGVILWSLRGPFEGPIRPVVGVLGLYSLPCAWTARYVRSEWEQVVAVAWLGIFVGCLL